MTQEVLVLKIFNEEYNVKLGDQDPQYIKKLADFVDRKITEFKGNFPALSYQKLLVVVCLNIADELFKLKEGMSEEDGKKIQDMLLSLKSLLVE